MIRICCVDWLAATGQGNLGELSSALLVDGVQMIACWITVIIVDKVGRRVLLLCGTFQGATSLIAAGVVLKYASQGHVELATAPAGVVTALVRLTPSEHAVRPAAAAILCYLSVIPIDGRNKQLLCFHAICFVHITYNAGRMQYRSSYHLSSILLSVPMRLSGAEMLSQFCNVLRLPFTPSLLAMAWDQLPG